MEEQTFKESASSRARNKTTTIQKNKKPELLKRKRRTLPINCRKKGNFRNPLRGRGEKREGES